MTTIYTVQGQAYSGKVRLLLTPGESLSILFSNTDKFNTPILTKSAPAGRDVEISLSPSEVTTIGNGYYVVKSASRIFAKGRVSYTPVVAQQTTADVIASSRDTDAEKELFVPARLSEASLRTSYGIDIGDPQRSKLDIAFSPLGATAPGGKLPARRHVTKIVDFGVTGHGWAANPGTASSNMADTVNFGRGTQSARITTKGDNAVASVRNTAISPTLNLSGRRFEVSVMVEDWSKVNTLLLYVGSTGFSSFHVITLWQRQTGSSVTVTPADNGEWVTLTADLSSVTSTTGTPDISAVGAIQVAIQDVGSGNAATIRINHIGHFPGSITYPNGVVSFTFDDSFLTHRTVAAPYLERYNFQGTFYTISELIGTAGYYMTLPQLRAMQDVGGHEIAGHAYTTAAHNAVGGLPSLSASALDQELRMLKHWLVTNGFNGRDHFAYPQGASNRAVEKAVRAYFSSSRSTMRFPVETWNPSSTMRLRTGFSSSIPYTFAQGQALVDKAFANGSWLIITTHDLVVSPPTPAGTTLVQWDIASYQQLVDYVASKGIPVRTVGDVLATV